MVNGTNAFGHFPTVFLTAAACGFIISPSTNASFTPLGKSKKE